MQLLLIVGPPAVGKMSVGRRIAERSDFRLFHNHHTIEPLVEVFGYGTPPFNILNSEFRRRVVEEAAAHGLDLIFTYVWDLEDPADTEVVEQLVAPYTGNRSHIAVVELCADLEERLVRNRGESRLAAKPTKRDLAWSEANVRTLEGLVLNTDPSGMRSTPADSFLALHPHLRLDTNELSEDDAATAILAWLADLQREDLDP